MMGQNADSHAPKCQHLIKRINFMATVLEIVIMPAEPYKSSFGDLREAQQNLRFSTLALRLLEIALSEGLIPIHAR